MRIIIVSAWAPWLAEDGDGSALILARHLRELGPRHEIEVLCAGGAQGERIVDGGVRVRSFGGLLADAPDHALRRVRSLRDREPAHVRWVTRPSLRRVLAQALATGPDVVHLFGWGTAGLWRELGGVPAVHTAVDPWARTLGNRSLPAWRRPFVGRQHQAVGRHEARHYPHLSAVVLVSEPDAAGLAEQVPAARFVVVPNGVDAGAPPVPPPMGGPVLVFHGSFGARANVEAARALATEVLPRVRAVLPDARVVLAGYAPGPDVLALARPDVTVLADVPDVRAMLDAAHIHVDLMTSGSGVKNKVLEALAAGRPVVATPLALQGLIGSGGTIAVSDATGAATAVLELVLRPGGLAHAGAAGRERVLAQTWAVSAQRIEQLWSEAARR